MTITWKEELNLLNDEQLGRIVSIDKDKWESSYYYDRSNGGCSRCVMGHLLDLTFPTMHKLYEYREQLGSSYSTPLQEFYDEFWWSTRTQETRKATLEQKVNAIQNEATRILEERKQRIYEPEIVII